MSELLEQFQAMELMESIYWGITIISTVLFLAQTIITFVGFDTDADFSGGDVDFDADGLHLLSVKTLICFLLGFGWTGALFYPLLESKSILALIAVAVGVAFMLLIAFLLKQVLKLSSDNTFSTRDIIDATAEVYLRIPGNQEAGKITVSYKGSLHELAAQAETEIPTGAKVKVVKVIDDSTVFVEAL